jgi:hypothetical protein
VREPLTIAVPVLDGASKRYEFTVWLEATRTGDEVTMRARVCPAAHIVARAWREVLADIAVGLPQRLAEQDATTEKPVPVFSILEV